MTIYRFNCLCEFPQQLHSIWHRLLAIVTRHNFQYVHVWPARLLGTQVDIDIIHAHDKMDPSMGMDRKHEAIFLPIHLSGLNGIDSIILLYWQCLAFFLSHTMLKLTLLSSAGNPDALVGQWTIVSYRVPTKWLWSCPG